MARTQRERDRDSLFAQFKALSPADRQRRESEFRRRWRETYVLATDAERAWKARMQSLLPPTVAKSDAHCDRVIEAATIRLAETRPGSFTPPECAKILLNTPGVGRRPSDPAHQFSLSMVEGAIRRLAKQAKVRIDGAGRLRPRA